MGEGDRTGGLVEVVVVMVEEATVEAEGVRWEPLAVDMGEEVGHNSREKDDYGMFELRTRHGLWWWLCMGWWGISWAVPWLVFSIVDEYG